MYHGFVPAKLDIPANFCWCLKNEKCISLYKYSKVAPKIIILLNTWHIMYQFFCYTICPLCFKLKNLTENELKQSSIRLTFVHVFSINNRYVRSQKWLLIAIWLLFFNSSSSWWWQSNDDDDDCQLTRSCLMTFFLRIIYVQAISLFKQDLILPNFVLRRCSKSCLSVRFETTIPFDFKT